MLAALVRILIIIFVGRQPFERKHISSVSKSIDYLPVRKRRKWLLGGLVHTVPISIVFILMLNFAEKGRHQLPEWIALILGASWGLIGPIFIWIFERLTLPSLWQDCRRRLVNHDEKQMVKNLIFSNTFKHKRFRVVAITWMIFVLYYFWSARSFVSGFGVETFGSLWWLFAVGTLFFAYYSALGICFALRSVMIVRRIARCTLRPDTYSSDNVLGFSFFGTFALRMNLMFLTGWLFLPLMVLVARDRPEEITTSAMTLVYGYALFVIAATLLPIFIVHRKLEKIRDKILDNAAVDALQNLSLHKAKPTQRTALLYLASRALVNDLNKIGTWPLNLDKSVVFLSTNFLPIALGSLATWLGWSK